MFICFFQNIIEVIFIFVNFSEHLYMKQCCQETSPCSTNSCSANSEHKHPSPDSQTQIYVHLKKKTQNVQIY